MHEDPLRPTAVKGMVSEIQSIGIPQPVLAGQSGPPGPPAARPDHRLTLVYADRSARTSDPPRQLPHDFARAATDVQELVPFVDIEHRIALLPQFLIHDGASIQDL